MLHLTSIWQKLVAWKTVTVLEINQHANSFEKRHKKEQAIPTKSRSGNGD